MLCSKVTHIYKILSCFRLQWPNLSNGGEEFVGISNEARNRKYPSDTITITTATGETTYMNKWTVKLNGVLVFDSTKQPINISTYYYSTLDLTTFIA